MTASSTAGVADSAQPSLLDLHDALLLDLDGVIYTGLRPVAHAADALRTARSRALRLAFVTNNASRTPQAVVDLLERVGVVAAVDEVATSAQAAARLLAERLPAAAAVLVVGGRGLIEAVQGAGLRPVTSADASPTAVVQGYDPAVGWAQLAEASIAVRAGALWVATNLDLTIPSERGLLPGNGSLVDVVRAAAGRGPDVVAGKPARPLHDEAVLRTRAQRPLVVGDRLDTDIEGAVAVRVPSMLVLTGVTSPIDLVAAPAQWRPTTVFDDLRGLAAPGYVVDRDGGSSHCGGWTATSLGSHTRLEGSGVPVDALRATLPLTWDLVDAGQAPTVDVPESLAQWWGSTPRR